MKPLQPAGLQVYFSGQAMSGDADGEAAGGGTGVAGEMAQCCEVNMLICCCSLMKQPCVASAWHHSSLPATSMEI